MMSLACARSAPSLTKPYFNRKVVRLPQERLTANRTSCSAQPSKGSEELWVPKDALQSLLLGGSGLMAPYLIFSGEALAKEGEYGLLEGRTLALIHPAVMISLFGLSCYAGYLGWQWRSLREIGSDIKGLKKELPGVGEDGVRPPSPLDGEIAQLEEIRKGLAKGNFRDRHYDVGTILLGGGVSIAVFGCLNTYLRTGKLFPGPHLFAGASIVALWAIAASLVPAMQKGNEGARIGHIACNTLNVVLFAWQLPTGFEIVGKVFEFTTWP